MAECKACGRQNLEGSRYCDECGGKLSGSFGGERENAEVYRSGSFGVRVHNSGAVNISPLVGIDASEQASHFAANGDEEAIGHATLTIERGASANTRFALTADESNIGRWDADNGIFPDIDLDTHDPDAKVSRKHARIIRRDAEYFVEDLGSTNGTFINRGRRLLPGTPQKLENGDEIIVGKTFLRFRINR